METVVLANFALPAVRFWGAARAVTGSMHLVEVGDRRILLDCGAVRGPGADKHRPHFPFAPATIAAVVLSHSHIDHCGNLPQLVRQGFRGPIYCTPATRDLVALMLDDAARFQEEEAIVQTLIGQPEQDTEVYTRTDAAQAVPQCVTVPYDQPRPIFSDVQLHLTDAGHILGSAMVSLTIAWRGQERTLTYTGDVGRHGLPYLREPTPLPASDVVLCESTYGGRTHDSLERTIEIVAAMVRQSFEQGGKVLVPAFSLGRMQVVVHYLRQWVREGRLPNLPIFVDGPLATDIADVYRRHAECFDPLLFPAIARELETNGNSGVTYVRSLAASKELCARRDPCLIVAATGTCDGGRIVRHLKQNVDDPRCSVILVSYQPPHSLGRRLQEPRPRVRFHGREWNLWAEVAQINGFSGHGDHNDLLALLVPQAGHTRSVRLVHGEPEQSETLANDLRAHGFTDVALPAPGDVLSLV